MLAFFQNIWNFLSMVVNFVVMLVESLLKFVTMVPGWIMMLTTSVGYLPGIIAPMVLMGIFLTIILLVVFH